jgi:predicted nucleotidyltransferase
MRVLGIIAEYNPFHNGHHYHLCESKRISGADTSVAVMSGNFMQRGEAAMLSKWDRSRIAADCGIDLVLELPFVYACNNAEHFAGGAIRILNGLSFIDVISFGSESGNIEELSATADAILHESDEFKEILKTGLKKGRSYPRALADAVRSTA